MMRKNHTSKIMVVEDDAEIVMRLQQRLTEMGYDVVGIAYSGEEAVEKARHVRPDLILMDIMMPGQLDGIAAAKIVKIELNIPVIFLTAFSEDRIIENAKQAEPYGYILKPFQDREIKAAIEVALYKKEMEEKLWKAHDNLDREVKERTADLHNALKKIEHRETELKQRKSILEKLNRELLEVNQALSVLARNIDKGKDELEKKISQEIMTKIMPIIKRLQKDIHCRRRLADLEVLAHYLNEIVSDSSLNYNIFHPLTDHEMRVAVMIKNGMVSQNIADMLNISLHTVKTHRKNIRRKLQIQNSKINLVSFLKSKFK